MNVWNLSYLHTEPSQPHSNSTDYSAITIVAEPNQVIMGDGGGGGELIWFWCELNYLVKYKEWSHTTKLEP